MRWDATLNNSFDAVDLGSRSQTDRAQSDCVGWDDERVGKLKARWAEGASAGVIAKELGGTTRNAVIGKLYRLGLAGRSKPVERLPAWGDRVRYNRPPKKVKLPGPSFAERLRIAAEKAAKVLVAERVKAGPDLEPLKRFIDLTEHQCRWFPAAESGMHGLCCGRQTVPGASWCQHHAIRVDATPVKRRREPIQRILINA